MEARIRTLCIERNTKACKAFRYVSVLKFLSIGSQFYCGVDWELLTNLIIIWHVKKYFAQNQIMCSVRPLGSLYCARNIMIAKFNQFPRLSQIWKSTTAGQAACWLGLFKASDNKIDPCPMLTSNYVAGIPCLQTFAWQAQGLAWDGSSFLLWLTEMQYVNSYVFVCTAMTNAKAAR